MPELKHRLEESGVKLDLFFTGSLQSQTSGPDASAAINALSDPGTGTGAYTGGRVDALLQLDSTRLGLSRGGQVHAHQESENGPLPGWCGGAFWPVSTAALLPLAPPDGWSLTSLYLRQKWGGTRLLIGKVNVIDLQSQNPFFGGWGIERFQNLALVLPPTGVTPVTMMTASLSQQIGDGTLTAMAYDPNDRTVNTFNRLFANGVNLSVSAQWNGRLWQRTTGLLLVKQCNWVGSVASIVLEVREPPLTHELSALAVLAGIELTPMLLGLQPFAVKARCSAEATPLPGDRLRLLEEIEALTSSLEARLLA